MGLWDFENAKQTGYPEDFLNWYHGTYKPQAGETPLVLTTRSIHSRRGTRIRSEGHNRSTYRKAPVSTAGTQAPTPPISIRLGTTYRRRRIG